MRKMRVMRKISQEKSLQSRIRRQDQTLLHPIKSVELNHQIERHSSRALNSTIRLGAQEERRLTFHFFILSIFIYTSTFQLGKLTLITMYF